jgi:hypothetical protein
MGYPPDKLFLVDSRSRFCTTVGLQPSLYVGASDHPIGVFSNTAGRVGIAHIPAGSQGPAGVVIETRPGCRGGVEPDRLPFPGAITYGP